MTPEEALRHVLTVSGASFPRGVLGTEVGALAEALAGDGDIAARADAAAAAHWAELRPAMAATIARADPGDDAAFALVRGWADERDADNPLARSLALRAATELAGAETRARERLRVAEDQIAAGGPGAAVAAATAAGGSAADLLDLDPDDFEPEIVEYVHAGRDGDALDRLARSTGDPDVRAWARGAVRGLTAPDAPAASAAVARLADGPPPEDPREDLVWVPTILSLVEEGIERALVAEAEDTDGGKGRVRPPADA